MVSIAPFFAVVSPAEWARTFLVYRRLVLDSQLEIHSYFLTNIIQAKIELPLQPVKYKGI